MTELQTLEEIVARGLTHYRHMGQALATIRAKALYRATARTWDDYCRTRWGFQANYANRLIAAAKVKLRPLCEAGAQTVPMGTKNTPASQLPENERQARHFARLSPSQQKQLMAGLQSSPRPQAAADAADITAQEKFESSAGDEAKALSELQGIELETSLEKALRLCDRLAALHAGWPSHDAADKALAAYRSVIERQFPARDAA